MNNIHKVTESTIKETEILHHRFACALGLEFKEQTKKHPRLADIEFFTVSLRVVRGNSKGWRQEGHQAIKLCSKP